jgi:hypothetical protein
MAFINVPGLVGKLYVPDDRPLRPKKHACPDCFGCQQCSDDRCRLCRSETMAAAGRGYDKGKPMRAGKRDVDFASTVSVSEILPAVPPAISSETCCGPKPPPASSTHERPGYRLLPFVAGFIDTPAGPVPRVATALTPADLIGAAAVRCGIGRNRCTIAPGLYAVGAASADSPVLVTANYKLSFDTLRRELAGVDAWVLVLDTRGVNVWCAAGKKLFSHEELALRVQRTGLERVVHHRRLILPQLAATGVSARQVKKKCGFEVVWGPVQARHVRDFLRNGMQADAATRRVTFTFGERLILVPVELSLLPKPTAVILAALFLMSGIGGKIFSFDAAWARGLTAAAAYAAGVLAGSVATPALLPWIPGRAFALKGALTGTAVGGLLVFFLRTGLHAAELPALLVLTATVSSYLAMNFTGSTPFTSPSGVEKEMRRAIPLQAVALVAFVLAWVGSAFAG